MVSSAASLGKIGTAPLVRLLLDNYGYTWSCLLVGALSLHTCIAGMLYQPPEWHLIPEPRDPEDDDVRLEDVPAPITSVAITDNGLVEQNGNPPASGAPAKTTTDDDDDDIIFVMPTTPTTVNPPGKDDEVILFSRVKDLREKTNIEDNKLPLALRDSKWSLSGSIPLLPVGDQKLFCSDDDDDQDDCCNDCLVVKVFRMLNYSLLKQPHFHLVAWANALSLLGYINTLYALPGYVSSLGYTPYQSAFAISSFSATEAVFRLIFAGLSDYSWFPIELVYTIGFTLSALFCGLLPVSSSYNWVMLCVAVNGISNSVSVVLFIHMIIKYLGVDQYSQVFSFVFMFNGAVIVVGGFLLGLVRDYFESYIATFLCISALYSTAAAIWWSRRCLKIIKNRYKKVPVHTQ
ncbi:uncharacterized protein LOC121863990 [Homarus americanus]|uniref:uncharacterized protein LOC121863990 n=1 Tax=Homarus americanus TaxID=6706 RepID=UPI001C47BA0B|nr:uncharacterized protein LOC121863990 [Homarus americanus]